MSTVENCFESTLPISVDDVRRSAWDGFAVKDGAIVLASIRESADFPGHFHCRAVSRTVSETKRPVIAEAVGVQMDCLLSGFGCCSNDLKWSPISADSGAELGEIIYFLRAGPFIKIGKATGGARARVTQLRTGCPYPIEIIGTVAGGYAKEKELHRRFQKLRTQGEWFRSSPELVDYIANLFPEVVA